ncbi:hypothetical protein [Phenylobacterium sp.]|uniref:hypothetical protein n=1 Tax=Phenylobacterium sp. TaxID=1871053 RepID=UPI0035B0C06C
MAVGWFGSLFRRRGLVGAPLEAVRGAALFGWFSFTPDDEAPDPSGRLVRFRPEGPAFRAFVLLTAGLDARGHIAWLELDLGPPMLSGANRPFGIDCVKSFLRALGPDQAADRRLAPLVAALEARMGGPASAPGALRPDAARALGVILGEPGDCEVRPPGLAVSFRRAAGQGGLAIRARPR